MVTRSQRYAAQIFKQMKELGNLPEAAKKKYGSTAHILPVLIRTAGLAQALAFVNERGKDDYKLLLLTHLSQTLGLPNRGALVECSRTAELPDYMRLTREVMAALVWYKRFAQSVLGIDPGDEADGGDEV